MKASTLGTTGAIIWLLLIIACLIGYCINLVDLFSKLGTEAMYIFIMRIIGIFAPPIGAIMGYFF